MIEDRMRAHDEQFPQISIAHLRDAAQPLLAAGRVLSRRQAKKGGEITRGRESGDVLNAPGTLAAIPEAVAGPKPGIVIRRRAISSPRAIAAMVRSLLAIS